MEEIATIKKIVGNKLLLASENDKWYKHPKIYDNFCIYEDAHNICFKKIIDQLEKDGIKIKNPVDLACGTGKITKEILNNLGFSGSLYVVDKNRTMLKYLMKSLKKQKDYSKIKVLKCENKNFKLENKSTFIVSRFGFPSKISHTKLCIEELQNIYSNLDDEGVFATIGWDEKFNDELSYMWFKFLPENKNFNSFEEWSINRRKILKSPRNAYLKWLGESLNISLEFPSIEDSAKLMGHMFGMEAVKYVIENNKTTWIESSRVTYNTKEEIKEILDKLK